MAVSLQRAARYLPAHLKATLTTGADQRVVGHLERVLHAICAYLPDGLVRDCFATPDSPTVYGEFTYTTLMFADIVGFTGMSEQLSELGREGAEVITAIVNDYFETMLALVEAQGGDLFKFGGDAMLVRFDGPDASWRACQSALAMQAAMERYHAVTTAQGQFALQATIGIGQGPIFQASLGTPDRLEMAIMGPAIVQMARAEDLAEPGEIVIDTATVQALGAAGQGALVADGFVRLTAVASEGAAPLSPAPRLWSDSFEWLITRLDALAPYLPGALLDAIVVSPQTLHLSAEGQRIEGEHRFVTVLFANFYGIDEMIAALGPDRADELTAILNQHFTAMQVIIERYGGIVNRIDSYAVGYRIMAIWGAPRAHEDDPARAVRAALEMQQTMDLFAAIETSAGSISLKQRIGINTGYVFAGVLGSSTRHEYTVMGDEVNLAARLMGIAGDEEVLISDATARQVGHQFQLQARQPVAVRGKREPVVNYQVLGVVQQAGRVQQRGSLVGREDEMAQLQAGLDRVLAGQGVLVDVVGGAGAGKTRLLAALEDVAHHVHITVWRGEGVSYSRTIPYLAWLPIFRALLGIDENAPTAERHAQMQATLVAAGLVGWAPIVGRVLDIEMPDNEVTAALEPRLRRERFFDVVLQLLQYHATHTPLMLVVDDVQWVDEASSELLVYLARNIASSPVLLAMVSRPETELGYPLPWLAECRRYSYCLSIVLRELDEAQSQALVQALVHPDRLPEALATMLVRRAQGNPLFLEHMTRALIERGLIQTDGSGTWVLTGSLDGAELPTTLQGLLMSRLDALDQVNRHILQVAAVIGRSFTAFLVAAVYPYLDLAGTLPRRLATLVRLDLALAGRRDPEPEYLFKHALIQEVAYNSLPFTLRRELHRRVGEGIERTYATTLAEHYGTLARHFDEGQVWDKAFTYAIQAGDKAKAEYANEAALAFYHRALDIADQTPLFDVAPALLAIREAAGDVCTLIGRYPDAIAHYQAAIELPTCTKRHQADLWRKVGYAHQKQSKFDEALSAIVQGQIALEDDKDCAELVRLYELQGWIRMRQGAYDETISLCNQGLDILSILEQNEDTVSNKIDLYNTIGTVHLNLGNYSLALEFYSKAAEMNKIGGNLVKLSISYNNLAVVCWNLGDFFGMSKYIHLSLELDRRLGDNYGIAMNYNNLGALEFKQGNYKGALANYLESIHLKEKVGDIWGIAQSNINMGEIYLHLKDYDLAKNYLELAINSLVKLEGDSALVEAYWLLAATEMGQGALEQALVNANKSLHLALKTGNQESIGVVHRIRGQIFGKAGNFEEAFESLKLSISHLINIENKAELGKSYLELGRVASNSKDYNEAQRSLALASDIFTSLNMSECYEESAKLLIHSLEASVRENTGSGIVQK